MFLNLRDIPNPAPHPNPKINVTVHKYITIKSLKIPSLRNVPATVYVKLTLLKLLTIETSMAKLERTDQPNFSSDSQHGVLT